MTDDPFRDDHEAALARADALERENQRLREENERLRAPAPEPAVPSLARVPSTDDGRDPDAQLTERELGAGVRNMHPRGWLADPATLFVAALPLLAAVLLYLLVPGSGHGVTAILPLLGGAMIWLTVLAMAGVVRRTARRAAEADDASVAAMRFTIQGYRAARARGSFSDAYVYLKEARAQAVAPWLGDALQSMEPCFEVTVENPSELRIRVMRGGRVPDSGWKQVARARSVVSVLVALDQRAAIRCVRV